MDRMPKAAEDRLYKSVEQVIGLVNAGQPPTDALRKVGADNSHTAEEVRRIAEAFNVSRSLWHLKQASGEQKHAAVKLADADQAVAQLFPPKPATPAVRAVMAKAASAGALRHVNYIDRLAEAESAPPVPETVKQAQAEDFVPAHVRSMLNDREGVRVKQAVSQATAELLNGILKAAADLRENFGECPFHEMEWKVAGRLGPSEARTAMLDMLWLASGAEKRAQRRATAAEMDMSRYTLIDLIPTPFASVESLVSKALAFQKASQQAQAHEAAQTAIKTSGSTKKKDDDKKRPTYAGVTKNDLGEPVILVDNPGDWSDLDAVGDAVDKAIKTPEYLKIRAEKMATQPKATKATKAATVQEGRGGNFFRKLSISLYATDWTKKVIGGLKGMDPEPTYNRELSKAIVSLEDPETENRLKQIRVQAMLSDFLANDPVIGSYDPSEVADFFNEIATLSPDVVDQPTIMRGLLRRALTQGQIEPFEAGSLAGIGKQIADARAPKRELLEAMTKDPANLDPDKAMGSSAGSGNWFSQFGGAVMRGYKGLTRKKDDPLEAPKGSTAQDKIRIWEQKQRHDLDLARFKYEKDYDKKKDEQAKKPKPPQVPGP